MARRFEVVSGNPWRDNKGRFSSPTKSQFQKYKGKKTEKDQTIVDKDVYEGKDLYEKYIFPDGDIYLVSIDGKTIIHDKDRFQVEDPIKWLEENTGYENVELFKVKGYNRFNKGE